MVDIFKQALAVVLHHEGGFVNDPVDPGGATNFGVSLRFLLKAGELDLDHDGFMDGDFDRDGDVDADDIRAMTFDDASKIYRLHWWDKYEYDRVVLPSVAIKLLDLSINMGSRQAHKCLQRALRSCGHSDIIDDGMLGPMSMTAVNKSSPRELVSAYRSEAAGFYRGLVVAKSKFNKYINGWLNRAYS